MPTISSAFPSSFPGFGLPVNYKPGDESDEGSLLPNALTSHGLLLPMITVQEQRMLEFMNTATNKENWYRKINDPVIAKKWMYEAEHDCFTQDSGSKKMAEWCIAELKHNAAKIHDLQSPPPIFVFNGDVYKSDSALSLDFKKRLQEAVSTFEAKIPDDKRDWHPGSNDTVWDLVHPSLFPVVYGRTRALSGDSVLTLDDCISRCMEGVILPVPQDEEIVEPNRELSGGRGWSVKAPNPLYSKKFQWLPCEVDISQGKARITTYINNLHPVHDIGMYSLVEEIIDAAISQWEFTLAPLHPDADPIRQRVQYDAVVYEDDPEYWPEEAGPQAEIGEDEDTHNERRYEWYEESRILIQPEPVDFSPVARPELFDLREKFKDRGLQVIVKLANIQLTPDHSLYEGGSWHVEGQINEHIVATAIYYYSNENITSSNLAFRHQVDTTAATMFNYPQNHHSWLSDIFNCDSDGPGVQDAGSVLCKEGRLLTFPNILQHHVEPFRLEDPTKPGHRKIVALFLVDPNLKILSTAKVPCQRKDWWLEYKATNPNSVVDHEFADFPLTMEDAKELRLELMEERKIHDDDQREYFELSTFALCEH